MASDDVDRLLERYLGLLDEYGKLREALAAAQRLLYQDLARANFAAERGMRYGPDHFDQRMQAARTVSSSSSSSLAAAMAAAATEGEGEGQKKKDGGGGAAVFAVEARPAPDPLRWFGVLVPPALRAAQGHAVRVVEDLVPRLASVDAEMARVEIEVRRARKKRAKAAAAAAVAVTHEVGDGDVEKHGARPRGGGGEDSTLVSST